MRAFPRVLAVALAVLSVPAFASTVTLGPGETYDWATNTILTTTSDTLIASGGAIVNLSGNVKCRIELSGEVQVSNASGATPRLYSKIIRMGAGGRLVLGGTVSVGGVNGAYAYVDDGVLSFAASAPDARLVFAASSYTVCQLLPQFWDIADRIDYGSSSVAIPFKKVPRSLIAGDVLTTPEASSGTHALRLPQGDLIPADVKVRVPNGSIVNFQPMNLLDTYGVSTINSKTVYAISNDFVLADGRFDIGALSPVTMTGDFTGSGRITVGAATSKTDRDRRFEGSLEGLDATSTLTVEQFGGATANGADHTVRLTSGFPGTVILEGSCASNRIDFGVTKLSGTSVRTLEFGAIRSTGKVTPSGTATFYGPMLQFNQLQHWHVGTLSGSVSVSPSQNFDGEKSSKLTVDNVADNTDLWIRYGMRLSFGTVGRNVRVHYMPNSDQVTNVIEVTGSGSLAEIELLGTKNAINLNGVSADAVTGTGKVRIVGGACRLGSVADAVSVDVQAGTVKFGSDANLRSVTAAESPALWLDASATARMAGAWNAKWASSTVGKAVLAANPKTTLNGQDTATYHGHPLVEKWFDCRADQNNNYGWQYRNYGYSSTLYTLVYPYLVENGLDGKPYMCFGSMGDTIADTAADGTGGSATDEKDIYQQERRRMPFMQGTWDNDGTANFEGHGLRTGTAILVFGSQQGGGRAMLGGYTYTSGGTVIANSPNGRKKGDKGVLDETHDPACSANFQRGGSAASTTAATPIFDNETNLPTWIDGVSVCPTNTGFNGGWQIVSFTDSKRNYSRSLGMSSRYAYAGGQNYAEILIYTNVLEDAERQAVEEYLAVKWGLPHAARRAGNVTVAKGACASGLVSGATGDGLVLATTGTDELTMSGAWSLTYADGAFAGVISEPDKRLVLPANLTVGLKLVDKPARGEYVLATAKSISGAENVAVQLDPEGRQVLNCSVQVRQTAEGAEIVLEVGGGMMIMVR